MNYRLLPPDEWDKLKPLYPPDRPLPSPLAASVVVAEQGTDLVGALFLQLALHMEPLIIHDPRVNFMQMVRAFDGQLPSGSTYYAFAPDAKIGRMAEIAGMAEVVGWRIYKKEV